MEIEEFFKNNKKTIIIFSFVYVIIMIFVIYYIWKPEEIEKNDIIKYKPVTAEDVTNKVMNNCLEQVAYRFILGEKEELADMISSDYFKYRGIKSNELMDEFEKDGFFSLDTQIKNITKYDLGDIYIYRGILTNGINQRYVNIIEEYPYEYELSFDDLYKYKEKGIKREKQKISFEIFNIAYNMTYMQCTIRITNLKNNYVFINLTENKNMVLVLEDGQEYIAEFPKSITNEQMNLNRGSNTTINVIFRIPLQEQENISHIEFKNVKLDGEKSNIEIVI